MRGSRVCTRLRRCPRINPRIRQELDTTPHLTRLASSDLLPHQPPALGATRLRLTRSEICPAVGLERREPEPQVEAEAHYQVGVGIVPRRTQIQLPLDRECPISPLLEPPCGLAVGQLERLHLGLDPDEDALEPVPARGRSLPGLVVLGLDREEQTPDRLETDMTTDRAPALGVPRSATSAASVSSQEEDVICGVREPDPDTPHPEGVSVPGAREDDEARSDLQLDPEGGVLAGPEAVLGVEDAVLVVVLVDVGDTVPVVVPAGEASGTHGSLIPLLALGALEPLLALRPFRPFGSDWALSGRVLLLPGRPDVLEHLPVLIAGPDPPVPLSVDLRSIRTAAVFGLVSSVLTSRPTAERVDVTDRGGGLGEDSGADGEGQCDGERKNELLHL